MQLWPIVTEPYGQVGQLFLSAILVGAFAGAGMAALRAAIAAEAPLEPAVRVAITEVARRFRD